MENGTATATPAALRLRALARQKSAERAYDYVGRVGASAALDDGLVWVAAHDPDTRVLGFEVLDALAVDHPWAHEDVLAAVRVGAADPIGRVRAEAVNALTDVRPCESWVDIALARTYDDDISVRISAISNLGVAFHTDVPNEAVRQALFELLSDPAPEVRDWAVMAFQSTESDWPELRDKLVGLLDEEAFECSCGWTATAGEAAVVLASLGDPRVLPILLAELEDPDVGNLYVEAASNLGEPVLLPALQRLLGIGWDREDSRGHLLQDAIAECTPRT